MGRPFERGAEADEGYERLYQAILRGDFQPNERLIEMDLAQRAGSRARSGGTGRRPAR